MKNITSVTGKKKFRLCEARALVTGISNRIALPEVIRRICLEREAIVVLLPNEAINKRTNMPRQKGYGQ